MLTINNMLNFIKFSICHTNWCFVNIAGCFGSDVSLFTKPDDKLARPWMDIFCSCTGSIHNLFRCTGSIVQHKILTPILHLTRILLVWKQDSFSSKIHSRFYTSWQNHQKPGGTANAMPWWSSSPAPPAAPPGDQRGGSSFLLGEISLEKTKRPFFFWWCICGLF